MFKVADFLNCALQVVGSVAIREPTTRQLTQRLLHSDWWPFERFRECRNTIANPDNKEALPLLRNPVIRRIQNTILDAESEPLATLDKCGQRVTTLVLAESRDILHYERLRLRRRDDIKERPHKVVDWVI
jgi:hypothetical protein